MNLLLVCHGRQREFGSFQLKVGQDVQYRGNLGAYLDTTVATALIKALMDDPLVSDQQLSMQLGDYNPHEPLNGPGSFQPDLDLKGDDALKCFIMNMASRKWFLLGNSWLSRLSVVIQDFGSPLWLNLLCCTFRPDANVLEPYVKPQLKVNHWDDVLR